ncbi:hypothetical protein CCP2SC5_2310003 [Azospirillaceae bacterium]
MSSIISRKQLLEPQGASLLRRYYQRTMGAATWEVRAMLQEFRDSWKQHSSQIPQQVGHVEVLRRELIEMAGTIEKARREVRFTSAR